MQSFNLDEQEPVAIAQKGHLDNVVISIVEAGTESERFVDDFAKHIFYNRSLTRQYLHL